MLYGPTLLKTKCNARIYNICILILSHSLSVYIYINIYIGICNTLYSLRLTVYNLYSYICLITYVNQKKNTHLVDSAPLSFPLSHTLTHTHTNNRNDIANTAEPILPAKLTIQHRDHCQTICKYGTDLQIEAYQHPYTLSSLPVITIYVNVF